MSVPNQIPESNYMGNGTTKTFAANFEYASDSDVFVTVNGVTPEIGQVTFANGVFTFITAPANGTAVRVYRSTPIERDTEYDNHDNVFRPRVVNIDFDRIWFVLQEYLLSLGITNTRITQEIADRIQADAEMMNYILNEDNELKADYILRDENLKKYIDQTLGALLELPDFQGIEAQFVKDSSGKNQQEINNSFSTAAKKLSRIVTPFDFGAIGDGQHHPVSEWTQIGSKKYYPNLTAIKQDYPHVTSLDDSIDWAALQAFFDYCRDNFVENACWSINAHINKELNYSFGVLDPKTKNLSGTLMLQSNSIVRHLLQMCGYNMNLGTIIYAGTQPQANLMASRPVQNGIIFGGYIDDDFNVFTASSVGQIIGGLVAGFGVIMGRNAHFANTGFMRSVDCGSGSTTSFEHTYKADWNSRVDTWGDIYQNTKIKVSHLPPAFAVDSGEEIYCVFGNDLHNIVAVDRANSTISVYPCLDTTKISGTLDYIYGGAYTVISGNTGQTTGIHLQAIRCGKKYDGRALYGTRFLSLTSENCGIGVLLGARNATHVGTTVEGDYVENNRFDIVTAWQIDTHKAFTAGDTIGSNPSKWVNMFPWRDQATNKLVDVGDLNCISVGVGRKRYDGEYAASGTDVTDKLQVKTLFFDAGPITIGANEKLFKSFRKSTMTYILVGSGTNGNPTGVIEITAPAGQLMNGGTKLVINGADYDSQIVVTVVRERENVLFAQVLGIKKVKKGATASRPTTGLSVGAMYMDTTLNPNGKPIFYTGSAWVDATGTPV